MTQEELVKKYIESKDKEKKAKEDQITILEQLTLFSPHKIGEIIKWVVKNRTKANGSLWNRTYEKLPDKECLAVLTRIEASVGLFSNGKVYYRYIFSLLKKDGSISLNTTYPASDYEWTGKIYQKKDEQSTPS